MNVTVPDCNFGRFAIRAVILIIKDKHECRGWNKVIFACIERRQYLRTYRKLLQSTGHLRSHGVNSPGGGDVDSNDSGAAGAAGAAGGVVAGNEWNHSDHASLSALHSKLSRDKILLYRAVVVWEYLTQEAQAQARTGARTAGTGTGAAGTGAWTGLAVAQGISNVQQAKMALMSQTENTAPHTVHTTGSSSSSNRSGNNVYTAGNCSCF